MRILNGKEPTILLFGDLASLYLSLWLMLFVRYLSVPGISEIKTHFSSFSIVFIIWVIVFFIAGLYGKHTTILKRKLPTVIFNSLIINTFITALFFYLIPYFGITPKTNLFIYLVIAFVILVVWRMHVFPRIVSRKRELAILVGSGREMKELFEEVNSNDFYNIKFISSIDLNNTEGIDFQNEIIERVYAEEVSVVAIDLRNEKVEPVLPHLYNLIFSKVRFIDMHKIYEDIFDRIPMSLVKYNWFIENISFPENTIYDSFKRFTDIVISLILLIPSIILFPFVAFAIKISDNGSIFITQERIGKNRRSIKVYKFRTMERSEDGVWPGETENKITSIGKFLRKSRIDELPQLWNVLVGDLSLIGPRPDMVGLEKRLSNEISYYSIRCLVKPGLSGWAQINQENVPHTVEESQERLMYDLYYIKNRSLLLDLSIALRTIKTLLSRVGR